MKLAEMTSPEIREVAEGAVAILPIGSTEQHGPHLPVATDALIVNAIAERVEVLLPDAVVLCPAVPYGSSHHHRAFSGTLTIGPDLFAKVIESLVVSLLESGFTRIVVFNGHGGNITPARQALAMVSDRFDSRMSFNAVLATYWELAIGAFQGEAPMKSPSISHACEYETSSMLNLRPELVHIGEIPGGRTTGLAASSSGGFEPFPGVSMVRRIELASDQGVLGEPWLGSAKKGEHLIEAATDALADFVERFSTWPTPDLADAT